MQNKIFKRAVSNAEKSPVGATNEGSINSPLHRFVRAKKRISQTFDEIFKYLHESQTFLLDCDILDKTESEITKVLHNVNSFIDQAVSINEVLKRDNMKVVFFGRTSNGKSTVVNAMLSEKILPAGIGHTTNCFVSVLGGNGNEAYMEDTSSGSMERKSVESLQQLAHALHNEKLDSSSLLKVYWPTSRCPLLKDDVVFVDSPGIDVSPDLDSWIDKHCLDADVFVLVVNSESTINHTEKSFFHKVNSKLSKPNIFILNNRWDASADDDPETIKLVKQQHLERTTEFLVDELKCVSQTEANDRIFFVSALETLRHRISQKKLSHVPLPQPSIDENSLYNETEYRSGKVARRQEFEDFELKFKECISKSAITTKFNGHTSTGASISKQMGQIMDQVLARAVSQRSSNGIIMMAQKGQTATHVNKHCVLHTCFALFRQWCKAERDDQQETLDFMSTKLQEVTEDIKSKILGISEEVEIQVTKAMSEEIRRLGHLVGEFDYPFHPHSGFLRNYIKELHAYIEKGLGKNLKARCSAPLLESIEEYKSDMQDQVFALIPADACSSSIAVSPRTSFNVSYELDIPNLCSDFHGDITFKFSLGWTNLVTRFIGPRNPRLALLLGATIRRSNIYFPQTCKQTAHLDSPSQKSLSPCVPSQMTFRDLEEEEIETVKRKQLRTARQQDNEALIEPRFDEDELTVAVIQGLSSLGSTTAMGIVVAASLIWKTVGWKLIAGTLAAYSSVYLYERAMWTNSAKEKAFKQQFVDYASEKLQLIVSFTSKGCSHQIQQELSTTFVQLVSQVDTAKERIGNKIKELDDEIQLLNDIEAKAKLFKNKATWLERDLKLFAKEFNLTSSKL